MWSDALVNMKNVTVNEHATLNDFMDAHMIEEESCPFQQEGKKLNITQKRELDNNELTVTAVQLEKLDDFHSNIWDQMRPSDQKLRIHMI